MHKQMVLYPNGIKNLSVYIIMVLMILQHLKNKNLNKKCLLKDKDVGEHSR